MEEQVRDLRTIIIRIFIYLRGNKGLNLTTARGRQQIAAKGFSYYSRLKLICSRGYAGDGVGEASSIFFKNLDGKIVEE